VPILSKPRRLIPKRRTHIIEVDVCLCTFQGPGFSELDWVGSIINEMFYRELELERLLPAVRFCPGPVELQLSSSSLSSSPSSDSVSVRRRLDEEAFMGGGGLSPFRN
jgi:hypothetical protein